DCGIAPEGFEKKEIPFIITIDGDGVFKGLEDTREMEGKKKIARSFIVPKTVKRSSGIAANLLWDNPAYLLGKPKPDKEKDSAKLLQRAEEQHMAFVKRIKDASMEPPADEGVVAILRFFEQGESEKVFLHPLWCELEKGGLNVTFRLESDTKLVCQREMVVKFVSSDEGAEDTRQTCLVTGEMDSTARLHTAIKGVWGAQSSGANIVSFNLSAFNSYGKTQGFNAQVGKKAEHAYTTALNRLLARGSRQRLQVGDASTVFWAEKPHKLESWFSDFFGETPKGESAQESESIRALYSSLETGAPPLEEDLVGFYVLGLSPNASRIAVRFWYAGTVGEVVGNIKQHFDDCVIVHGPKEREYLSIFRLLVSTAVQGDAKNIQPNLAGGVMKSILNCTPYPTTLLSSALRRIRAEREVTYPRASLIKALLVRDSRYYKRDGKEVGMSLDKENNNQGYLLGRLFAVLEKAQERANPGLNATIRDRFYGSASSTPGVAFPHLMKLKNHHIAKLKNKGKKGEAVNLEKSIGGIMEGLSDFPGHLSLRDQGRFAVGYYHQRQDFFKKKDEKAN
ncbi:CRISPR-associated protein, Csd1 family, partial [hydrothermal vent metagenome]